MSRIRHVVLVRFAPATPEAEIAAIFADLAALKARVPGMLDCHAGANVSPEGLGRGHAHGFTIDFADAAARDRYLADEAHARAGARLTAAAEGGIDGILVVDLDLG